MIIYIFIDVKEIFKLGKTYPWVKPDSCPVCAGIRLWGHGYVERYFEGFIEKLWLKRYRCPECKSVHIMRPELFWPRFHYRVPTILSSLRNKVKFNRWLPDISRQNQQYWFKGLNKQLAYHYPYLRAPTLRFINLLHKQQIILSSHILFSETLRL